LVEVSGDDVKHRSLSDVSAKAEWRLLLLIG